MIISLETLNSGQVCWCPNVQFIHDQVKGTGRNSVFGLSHRLCGDLVQNLVQTGAEGLHFEHWSPLYAVENKATPGLNRRLLTEGL